MHYHTSFGLNGLSPNFATAIPNPDNQALVALGILFMKIPSASSGEKVLTRTLIVSVWNCWRIVYRLIYESVTHPLIYSSCNRTGTRLVCVQSNNWYHLWWKAYIHDDVIKWKHFPRYWPFVWEIHRSPVNSPHKGQWRGALMFSLICAWINGWVNHREAGDLRRHRPITTSL